MYQSLPTFTFVQKCTRTFIYRVGTILFWRTILTSIITWYNYIFTYLPKYEIELIIECILEQPDIRFWIPS